MVISIFILVFSVALFLFYLQAVCERILLREFADPLSEPIIEANSLAFPAIRKLLEQSGTPAECSGLRESLKADCWALVHLLKHAFNRSGRLTSSERLLTLYFRALSAVANVAQGPALLRMIAVLEYFANVLGERAKSARFGSCAA